MQMSYGHGGWVRVDDADMPGPLYLRYRSDSGRPVLIEFYLDARGHEVPPGLFRALDLAGVTAWGMRDAGDWLARSVLEPGPDLSRLASYYGTTFGSRAKHWVADSWRAQIRGSAVAQAPVQSEPDTREEPRQPDQLKRPHRITDDFLRAVADNYAWSILSGDWPAPQIAAQTGYSVRTAQKWIGQARARGFLAPTTKGRMG
jgi:hypothetical protein